MNAEQLARRAAAGRMLRVVLPEGTDERILAAAGRLRDLGFVHPVLIGNYDMVSAAAASLQAPLHGIDVVDTDSNPRSTALASLYLRRRENTSAAVVHRMLRKPLFHAGLMVAAGDADAMVAGATCTTARVIEAALLTVGLAEGVNTPSSCFLMAIPGRAGEAPRELLFADCALNVEPSPEALADIGIASATSFAELVGAEPAVAFLSFSTHGSGRHAAVERVRSAVEIARQRRPDLAIDGELQADSALCVSAARRKIRTMSTVAGRANVLVFPDLNAANIGYKLVQYLGGATAAGPLLQGFARPVADLSRGATVEDIVQTALLTIARAARHPDLTREPSVEDTPAAPARRKQ